MVRSIQPWLIIDNRLEGSAEDSGSILTANPTEYSGDFASPEQMIPPAGIRNELGDPVPWEACLTLNNNWGYSSEWTVIINQLKWSSTCWLSVSARVATCF